MVNYAVGTINTGDKDWIPAKVPGNIQADLEAAHVLNPLWYGTGDSRLFDVCLKDWWYRKDFFVPDKWRTRRIKLIFEGVDYECEVWLNGKLLGVHEGMFQRFWFDVNNLLKYGQMNKLALKIARMPKEKSDAVLEMMKKEGSEEVEGLLHYDDDTAGGIMVPDFIALREDTTAGEAIKSLQKEHMDVEMPFYLYAVDEYDNLVGVSSLRQLVVVPPETPLKEFMTTDVFSVQTSMDQEEVAKIVAR